MQIQHHDTWWFLLGLKLRPGVGQMLAQESGAAPFCPFCRVCSWGVLKPVLSFKAWSQQAQNRTAAACSVLSQCTYCRVFLKAFPCLVLL